MSTHLHPKQNQSNTGLIDEETNARNYEINETETTINAGSQSSRTLDLNYGDTKLYNRRA